MGKQPKKAIVLFGILVLALFLCAIYFKQGVWRSEFERFVAKETTKAEVKATVGEPAEVEGFGLIGDVYYTLDGYKVTIYYCMVDGATVVDVIVVQDSSGEGCILVQ